MKRKELLTRLCTLASVVGDRVFDNDFAHDCFCEHRRKEKGTCYTFSFNQTILHYIENAVSEKMEGDNVL